MNQTPGRTALLTALTFLCACSARPTAEPAMQKGPAPTSITVYPVVLVGQPNRQVANVVGILLERSGMPDVRIETTPFQPDASLPVAAASAAFSTFVKTHDVATDRALFVDVRGTPGKGASEIRTVLVAKDGTVLMADRQASGDAAFDEAPPKEPMECCMFVARRLQAQLGTGDPRTASGRSKLADAMAQQSGVPDAAEQARMHARMETLRELGAKARIRVWPARTAGAFPAATATGLADRLAASGVAQFAVAEGTLPFTAEAGMNEQRTLWSGARSIQAAVKKLPPSTDHHLVCDFVVTGPTGKEDFVAVHTYLLAPDGELVLCDYQNEHHADFRAVDPKDADSACELAARRVLAALRGR